MRWDWGKTLLFVAIATAGVVSYFSDNIDAYALQVVINMGICITLAVSLNLIVGYTGQFSLGHAGFMAIGAYTAAIFTSRFTFGPPPVLFPCALIAGGLTAALTGLIVGIPTLRLRGDYLAIATLGFGEIVRTVLQNWDFVGASRGFSGIPFYTNVFWVFLTAAVCVYVVVNLVNSTYGRGFLATRDDEIAAEAMGVNTTKYKVNAFVIGAFFAGIAGGLYGHSTSQISPEGFNFQRSVEIIVVVILGGMGRTVGVIAAAILLTALNEWLRAFSEYRMVIYSLLLIVMMIARPQGLMNFDWLKKWSQKAR